MHLWRKQDTFQAENSISTSEWNGMLLGFGSTVRFPHATSGTANKARTTRGPCDPTLRTWVPHILGCGSCLGRPPKGWRVSRVWNGPRRSNNGPAPLWPREDLACVGFSTGSPSIWVQHLGVCKTGSLYHSKSHPSSHATDCSNQMCNGVTLSFTTKGTETCSLDLKPGLPHLWENTVSM